MDNSRSNTEENVLERCVSDCEKAVIIHALTRTKGNQSAAAMLLGTTKRVLAYKVQKYSIDCAKYRGDKIEEL
ncbi:MAG: helix-turn-helix domain-containing protein [Smithellaceae bacterium]